MDSVKSRTVLRRGGGNIDKTKGLACGSMTLKSNGFKEPLEARWGSVRRRLDKWAMYLQVGF